MNRRFVAIVGVFCIAILVVSGVYGDKPDNRGNPDKPDKPDKPNVPGQTEPECIVFSGTTLNSVPGGTIIEGCCLNAGPWPEYTMDLNLGLGWSEDGETPGFLHIGAWLPGPDGGYVVQFWNYDVEVGPPGDGDYLFEIWGGEVIRDRKRKLITVTFGSETEPETGTLWVFSDGYPEIPNTKTPVPVPGVFFVLERTSNLDFCGG